HYYTSTSTTPTDIYTLSLHDALPIWREVQSAIYQEIMEWGWNPKEQCFVQYYGSDCLDASNLLMPMVKFISPTDPRMLETLTRTDRKSTRLNSSHQIISYAVFCLKKK